MRFQKIPEPFTSEPTKSPSSIRAMFLRTGAKVLDKKTGNVFVVVRGYTGEAYWKLYKEDD